MKIPQPGASTEIDRDHRIAVVDGARDGQLRYGIEVRFGGHEWQPASMRQYEAFEDAVGAAHQLRHHERGERPEILMSGPQMDWPGPEPWSEARLPEVDYCGPGDMRLLSDRIRRGRNRVGWR